MNTIKRYLLAVAICLLSGMAITGAIGIVAFVAVRVIGVQGASWSSVGFVAIIFGVSMLGLLAVDHFDIGGDL